MFEEKFVINGKKYTMQNLLDVWNFFKEKGYPSKFGHLSKAFCSIKYYHSAFLGAKQLPEFKNISEAHDNLDIDMLFWEAATYFKLWKKAEAKFYLKDRKPLSEEEFRAGEYEKYLKDFEEETKYLKKVADEEE